MPRPFLSSVSVCICLYEAGFSSFWSIMPMSQRARSSAVIASSPAAKSQPLPSLGATRRGPRA